MRSGLPTRPPIPSAATSVFFLCSVFRRRCLFDLFALLTFSLGSAILQLSAASGVPVLVATGIRGICKACAVGCWFQA
ncbi:unnamed protein product [Urochloa humidicola]